MKSITITDQQAELLAALKACEFEISDTLDHLERLYDASNPYCSCLRNTLLAARAAIARAEGRDAE